MHQLIQHAINLYRTDALLVTAGADTEYFCVLFEIPYKLMLLTAAVHFYHVVSILVKDAVSDVDFWKVVGRNFLEAFRCSQLLKVCKSVRLTIFTNVNNQKLTRMQCC